MAYPDVPARAFSYQDFALEQGDSSFPGQKLDTDLDALRRFCGELLDQIKVIQRADAQLTNKIVHYDTLDDYLRSLLGNAGAPPDFSALIGLLQQAVVDAQAARDAALAAAARAEAARDRAEAAALRAEAARADAIAAAAAAAASAAQAAQSAAQAKSYYDQLVALGGQGTLFPTLASAAFLQPSAGQVVAVAGILAAGDNAGRTMVLRNRPDEPPHALKVQFANGRWGEVVTDSVTPAMFGAVPVGDNTAAFAALKAYPYASEWRLGPSQLYASGLLDVRQGVRVEGEGALLNGGITGTGYSTTTGQLTVVRNVVIGADSVFGTDAAPCPDTVLERIRNSSASSAQSIRLGLVGSGAMRSCRMAVAAAPAAGVAAPLYARPVGGALDVSDNESTITYPGTGNPVPWGAAISVVGGPGSVYDTTVRNNRCYLQGNANVVGHATLVAQDTRFIVEGNALSGGLGIVAGQVSPAKFLIGCRIRGNFLTPFLTGAANPNAIVLSAANQGQVRAANVGGNAVSFQAIAAQPTPPAGFTAAGVQTLTFGPDTVDGPAGTLTYRDGGNNASVRAVTTAAVTGNI